MDTAQSTECHDGDRKYEQVRYSRPEGNVTLTTLTELLDAALHTWDQDRITAKSRIRAAATIARDALAVVRGKGPQVGSGGLAPWQTRKVTEFIEASLESKIRVRDCARQTRLSAGYFSIAFKATFGTTVGDYISRRRIERAQQLMLLSTMALSEVAVAVGFSDHPHYCRVFRRIMRISPSAWRRKNLVLMPTNRSIVGDAWQTQACRGDTLADQAKRVAVYEFT